MTDKITSFREEYAFLSNFYPCQVTWEDETYPTVEHAFQAAKTHDVDERATIRNARGPVDAKRMGRRVSLRQDWDEVKVSVMETLIRDKFSDPRLRDRLLSTGDAALIEGNTWGDRYWGIDIRTGKGSNRLGRILESERTRLRREG